MDSLALMCDKTGVSGRAAASIASAVLEDLNLIDKDNTDSIEDRSKLRRARKRTRSEYKNELKVVEQYQAVYFDGRKDDTKIHLPNSLLKLVKEEHVSLLQEHDSKCITYVNPGSGTAKNFAEASIDFFQENRIKTDDLIAVRCDGTTVNTGQPRGIIKLLEEKRKRSLNRFICLLHYNELPLQHLINAVGGKTSGPWPYRKTASEM